MSSNVIVKSIDSVWQNPQSFCITEFIRDELFYYFKCWDYHAMLNGQLKDTDFIGCFNIEKILAVKHTRFTQQTLYPVDFDHNEKCYYYIIEQSPWLQEVLQLRNSTDKNWTEYDTNHYQHFILENGQYWIEVIGSNLIFDRKQATAHQIQLWETI